MKFYYYKKYNQGLTECDGGCCDCATISDIGTPAFIPGQIPGMGPVNPSNGPDKWDVLGNMSTQSSTNIKQSNRKKRKKIRILKNGRKPYL